MKINYILSFLLISFLTYTASAQIQVDSTYSPIQLVEDVLMGTGIQASNISFIGVDIQLGYFDGTNSNIGIGSGASSFKSLPSGCTLEINNISAIESSCDYSCDGSAEATVTGGTPPYTYDWKGNGQTFDTNPISNLCSDLYEVTVSDASGCTAITAVNVPSSVFSINTTSTYATCFGTNDAKANVMISGGVQPYTYQWGASTGFQTTPTVTGLSSGVYQVTVTDANGCMTTTDIVVDEPDELNININLIADVSCAGGSNGQATVVATGGTPDYTYQWSANASSQITPTATNLQAGIHTVTVIDANNCFAITSVSVSEPSLLNLILTSDNSGSATAVVTGGTPEYTYEWSDGQQTDTATNLLSGTYLVTVTDANGCAVTGEIDLIVDITTPEHLTGFDIQPNVSDGHFMVDAQFDIPQEVTLQIFNRLGQQVYHSKNTTNHLTENVDISREAADTYFVMISTQSGQAVQKIVLTN